MSRIIVKNLPAKATEKDVKAHFASKGQITDVKVLRKRDGSSRRFAFVGFKSDEEAEEAVRYFNLSYLNSSRLDVSLAKPLGDEELLKRKETLKRKRLEEQSETSESKRAVKKDVNSQLNEFLQVMQPQKSTALWKNDNAELHVESNESDDEVNDMTEPKAANDSAEEPEQNIEPKEEVSKPEKETEEEEWDPAANLESEHEDEAPEMSDMEWLKQRQTRIKENGEKPEQAIQKSESDLQAEPDQDQDQNQDQNQNKQVPTNRLFVRNLAFTASRDDLQRLFSPFGIVKQVHIPLDPRTDKPKGIAFVEFDKVDEAVSAHTALDGSSFQGRLVHLLFASEQRGYVLDEFDIKNMPLKKQKALKRRTQAAKQQFSWNSLYLNRDAVIEATAKKLGMTKSEMLDPHSANTAVQQALAESSVLESVQSYFKSKGVDLQSFAPGKSQDLSDSVILVKNLPFQVSSLEIQDMFAAYGPVERTLMPPDGGIAIVQMKVASDGRNAFKKLAFRRVGESIMYLQKAPKGAVPEVNAKIPVETVETTKSVSAVSASDILLPSSESVDADIRTSVFVKNLSFSTSVESLTKLFQGAPGFISAVIKTKPDPQQPKKQLSMGFGFVEFRTLSQAQAAVSALNDKDLDGHKLQLKISHRGEAKPTSKSGNSTKIVVKNVPFETSKQDIVELLGTFGHLRSVRVPRKFNRQSRGFAFAEFATPKEAEHALDSLRGAHLLGRRLVMDYAEADAEDAEEEIARMEAKVSRQVAADRPSRLSQQKGIDMDEE